ncbi:NADH-quinone oxidoreductase subunit NuoN [uncultured Nocardioides sp.]|uniref:NADH-quinone oxidoreductase subunit NuoN n=1 Tax=uncultured Nocardioides sp. TaxID=198441 RepID=UPI0026139F26|nr:NADH-quinone oxidoreductase subunit NuoN [uncultured Nocardioides sp.]
MEFSAPQIAHEVLWPAYVVFGAALLGVLGEAFLPRRRRFVGQVAIATLGLIGGLVGTALVALDLPSVGSDDVAAYGVTTVGDTVALDGPTMFLWGLVLLLGLGGVGLFAERRLESGLSAFAGQAAALPGTEAERKASTEGLDHTEVYPLLMFAVVGMMLFPAANDLLTLFVALEVLSLPLYLLCGLSRRRRLLSQEAAMKYFLLGAFSSGFVIYGIALVYGFSGSMSYAAVTEAVRAGDSGSVLLLTGLGMITVGMLFKVGAVPFHAWTPDVYQGAPTAVTAFMSAATKVAAFGATLRLFYVAFGSERWTWQPMLWVVAIITMLVGAVLAVSQTDVKRMLAYSSIAHTGFILTGLIGLRDTAEVGPAEITSLQAVLFYLVTYSFATLGAFALVGVVRDDSGEVTAMARWAGLGRRSPVVAGVFALFLLSMAGIPLTAGFVGKWAVFAVAVSAGAWPVVVVALASSMIAVFFYVRVILLMYFTADPDPSKAGSADVGVGGDAALAGASSSTEAERGTVTVRSRARVADAVRVETPSLATVVVIAVCVGVTVLLGVMPGPVLDLAGSVGTFIR